MRAKQQTSVIYTLYTFDGKGPRYCGHTAYPKSRLLFHRKDKKKTHKCNWIASVGPEKIHMSLIAIVPSAEAPAKETFYIKRLKEMGFKLTNLTDGGEGTVGFVHSQETRDKISAANTNPSIETRAKIGAANTDPSPETRAKMSRSQRRRKATPETKAKMSARLMGNTRTKGYEHTPETKAKISAAGEGRVWSAESRAKMSEIKKHQSAETRAKNSASQRGKILSPEHCAAISARRKGVKASLETHAKTSASLKGRPFTPEHRANIAEARKNRSPEAREETRAKMSLAQKLRHQRKREHNGDIV
jgi:group I intron endonuclease